MTKDVPDYALIMGNPGRQKGWMSRHGHPLKPGPDGVMVCPESKYRYQLQAVNPAAEPAAPAVLRCLDLAEDLPLPETLARGAKAYREFKAGHPRNEAAG